MVESTLGFGFAAGFAIAWTSSVQAMFMALHGLAARALRAGMGMVQRAVALSGAAACMESRF